MSPPTARCARRPWVGATAFLFLLRGWRPRNLPEGRAVGRGGGVERHGWRVHVIAFALPLPRFASQTVGPVSPAPTPRRFAAAPDSGAPYTRRIIAICSADPWSAECSRQRPAALADH